MNIQYKIKEYQRLVGTKYHLYNSLFMKLPYERVKNIGMLIPLLHRSCIEGFEKNMNPHEIIEQFFRDHTDITTEEEKIDFFFRVIQYVERQVVLFDSVEDAAYSQFSNIKSELNLEDFFQGMQTEESRVRMQEKLDTFGIRIVLTAHPTQFYPQSVLELMTRLRTQITENDIDGIDLTLQQLGMTSFLKSTKPTPDQEASNIIYFLRYVYYEAISELYEHIKGEIPNPDQFDNPELISLGFWPGGDRDGNPYVTADTTMKVADELRMTLMKCYYHDIKALEKKLTFRKVEEKMAVIRERLYTSMFNKDFVYPHDEILESLAQIREILITDYNKLYLRELDRMIDRVKIFKSHFASLDIRQDHSKHKALIEEILKKEGMISSSMSELSEDRLTDFLLSGKISLDADNFEDQIFQDTIRNIKQLATIQSRNGKRGCHRYIISNSEDIYSVLFVFALFRFCGYEPEEIDIDIVPLFETMAGMEAAEETMRTLFSNPIYRSHVARRKDQQTIMLGFSDGTKDGGYVRANWSIYNTKETLTAVCKEFGIDALFFDGRGGPPARGGGKSYRFYASLGEKIANHEIQLTIQGQTITSTYGTREQFKYNCEQLISAGLSNEIRESKEDKISDSKRALMNEFSQFSFDKYQALKDHDLFIPYLEKMSTLKYYSQANIGSRPAKRGKKEKLTLSDLRAISFVGSWSQLKQNVPGYYGIGTALNKLKRQGKLDEVRDLFNTVPYFKALMLNSMMSLSKTFFPLTSYMKDNPEFSDFWHLLYDEYQLTLDLILEISGYEQLMQEEVVSRMSIQIREQIVLPLLTIQQYALQKIAEDGPKKEVYEKIVTRSMYGNINASRNSA